MKSNTQNNNTFQMLSLNIEIEMRDRNYEHEQ